jgi:VWFA-related protein
MNPKLIAPFVAALTLLAQTPVPQQTVIRVTTRLVEVNVIARDKNGPLRDLTRDDFTVLDRGREQKIAFFSVNVFTNVTKPPAPLPPRTFTNRLEQRGETAGSVTIVLFDTLNTDWPDQAYAKQELVKFLSKVQPQDRVGIYVLGTSLRVIQDFTNDSRRLINALMRLRGETFFTVGQGPTTATVAVAPKQEPAATDQQAAATDQPAATDQQAAAAGQQAAATGQQPATTGLEGEVPPGVDRPEMPAETADSGLPNTDTILNHINGLVSDRMTVDRASTTMAAMEMIAGHLARMPGRKNLIWVSGSFPLSIGLERPIQLMASGNTQGEANRVRRFFTRELDSASRALNNANIAVYPVDARGLVGTSFTAISRTGPVERSQVGSLPSSVTPAGQETMKQIAKFTGGRAFYNTNDIQGAVRAAVEDSEVSYTLGFYPAADWLDSTFHPIKVVVKRPGVQLRYRQGYVADLDSLPTAAERNEEIGNALWSALEATGISLTARLENAEQPRPGVLRIFVDVDLNDVEFLPREHRYALDIVLAQRSPDGRELRTSSETLELTIDPSRYDALLKQGLSLERNVELASNASQLRIVVFDRASGHVGSVAVPVKQ